MHRKRARDRQARPQDGEDGYPLFGVVGREKGSGGPIGQGSDAQRTDHPAIEGRVGTQEALHHAHLAAAENEADIAELQMVVPRVLQDGGQGRLRLDGIGKLVEDDDMALLALAHVGQRFESLGPILVGKPSRMARVGVSMLPHFGRELGQKPV